MKRAYALSAVAYITLAMICYRAPSSSRGFNMIGRVWRLVWLAGPPANLVYGNHYVWPFVIGTGLLACLTWIAEHARGRRVRLVLWSGIAILWCIFGACVYVPSF
jgi:hypothetical protein